MSKIWMAPVELSTVERRIVSRCRKRKIFVFLRRHRHELFDERFQRQLWSMYSTRERGKERVHPVVLCLASLLQAALDVPDHEAVELTLDSLRWRMVLHHEDEEKPAFSQGTLFNFRERMMKHNLDKALFERTVALARGTGGFSATRLRAAFDASPLWGAGRVEDTFNLIGRALWHVVRAAAALRGLEPATVAEDAGVPVVLAPSIKAGLDLDWDDPTARQQGLDLLLAQVDALAAWIEREAGDALEEPPLNELWATLQRLIEQDTEPDPAGSGRRIRRGVAAERQISVSDPDMRHGRKSKKARFNGYKRHIGVDLDRPRVICAVAVTRGNRPEREAAGALLDGLDGQQLEVAELAIDRGYLGSTEIEVRRQAGTAVHCKPWPLRNGRRFTKSDFKLDLAAATVTCPSGEMQPLRLGKVVRFPATACDPCTLRERCTRAKQGRGRSLAINEREDFFLELRARMKTNEGRAQLRQRITVEHGLAALLRTQGRRARYRGTRKNLYDLRRHAAVNNVMAWGESLAA